MRWLLDQGLPRSTVGYLNEFSYDTLHVGDIGMASASDREILAEACKQNRIIVTLDADFHSLLAISSATKPSVIRIREEGLKGKSMALIVHSIAVKFHRELNTGYVFSYRERKLRLRSLPL